MLGTESGLHQYRRPVPRLSRSVSPSSQGWSGGRVTDSDGRAVGRLQDPEAVVDRSGWGWGYGGGGSREGQ